MKKPKVLLVGGMGFNIPDELKAAVDIVKHIEQGTRKLASLPAVEFILVISEFASHNIVETVKNEAKVPIVYLRKGWASMKEELLKRCILPPDPVAGGEAPPAAVVNPETGTLCGLSEDEIWETYKEKFIHAVREALKPRELVSHADLLDVLSMAAGVPASDCALILHNLTTLGVIDSPIGKEGFWVSRLGAEEFDDGSGPDMLPPVTPRLKGKAKKAAAALKTGFSAPPESPLLRAPIKHGAHLFDLNAARAQETDQKAALLKGLPFGPYASKKAIMREMLKYEEWAHLSLDSSADQQRMMRLINRAIKFRIIDDTAKNFLIDHDPKLGLRQVLPPEKELPPPPEPPAPAPAQEAPADPKSIAELHEIHLAKLEEMGRRWPEVVAQVKKQKKTIGTILESCRFKWLDREEMTAVVMVPPQLAMYEKQLGSVENWGLVSQLTREILGKKVVVRYLMANGI